MSQKLQYNLQPSIASNGKYLFVLFGKSLYKIGTGFNGTLKGYVYGVNTDFSKEKSGWIGFCGVSIYIPRIRTKRNQRIINKHEYSFFLGYFVL